MNVVEGVQIGENGRGLIERCRGGSSKEVEGQNIGKMVGDLRSYTDSEFLPKVPS